jgi:hypothetical protein
MNNQAAQTMPALVDEALAYFAKAGDEGDRRYIEAIRKHIAALSQTAGVPEGFVMVPMEPTPQMVTAGFMAREKQYAPEPLDDFVASSRAIYRAMLAAAPAASGGEDYSACCDTPAYCSSVRRCTAKDSPPAGASASERARELLAIEYEGAGYFDAAAKIRTNGVGYTLELRAIEQALTQQRVCPACASDTESYCCACGWASVEATPQPGAEALRELVQRWREDGSPYMDDCADELESLLGRGAE